MPRIDTPNRQGAALVRCAEKKNRRRGSAAKLPVHLIRATLDARMSSATALCWPNAASAPGVQGTDAFLIQLGRYAVAAIASVDASAEAAQAQLQEARTSLHAAIDARCDDLSVKIDSTRAAKVASLESELVGIEAALVRWRSATCIVREALLLLPDGALEAQYPALSSCLDETEAQLKTLRTAVVETPLVGLLASTPALLRSVASFGRVLAPLSVTAVDLSLHESPSNARVSDLLRLRLSLGVRHTEQCAEELEMSLGMLAGATCVVATFDGAGGDHPSLHVTLVPDSAQRCLLVTVDLPDFFSDGAPVSVAVSVAGETLSGPPLSVSLRRGTVAYVSVAYDSAGYCTTPCISFQGQLYCAPGGSEVLVYDTDGTQLPGISVASIGLSSLTIWTADYARGDAVSLLLADCSGASSRLVEVDPSTRVMNWATAEGSFDYCGGIAVLPSLGVVVVRGIDTLFIHSLSDGSRVGSSHTAQGLGVNLTADPESNTVYASVYTVTGMFAVHSWSCNWDDADSWAISSVSIAAARKRLCPRILAVVPPARGKLVSHLVVGSKLSAELLVLALPGLELVHTHRLKGVGVLGLAADPWGEALAVCDANFKTISVLSWPLPGMAPLE